MSGKLGKATDSARITNVAAAANVAIDSPMAQKNTRDTARAQEGQFFVGSQRLFAGGAASARAVSVIRCAGL